MKVCEEAERKVIEIAAYEEECNTFNMIINQITKYFHMNIRTQS